MAPPRCRGAGRPNSQPLCVPLPPAGSPWACLGEAVRGGFLLAGELTGHPSSPARLPVTLTPGVQGQGPDACAFCGAGGQG